MHHCAAASVAATILAKLEARRVPRSRNNHLMAFAGVGAFSPNDVGIGRQAALFFWFNAVAALVNDDKGDVRSACACYHSALPAGRCALGCLAAKPLYVPGVAKCVHIAGLRYRLLWTRVPPATAGSESTPRSTSGPSKHGALAVVACAWAAASAVGYAMVSVGIGVWLRRTRPSGGPRSKHQRRDRRRRALLTSLSAHRRTADR